MKRHLLVVVLVGAGLTLTPAGASAQFMRPFGLNYQQRTFVRGPGPYPFFFSPRFFTTRSMQFFAPGVTGSAAPLTLTTTFVGTRRPQAYMGAVAFAYGYGQYGSYITGSVSPRSDILVAQQRALEKARIDLASGVKTEIKDQWRYEKGTRDSMPELGPLPDPVQIALDPTDPGAVTSGEVHNVLLQEIVRAEARVPQGTKVPSAYVPPLLLEDIRFGGAPAGDLLNLARQAGNLNFPAAFDAQALGQLRGELEKDFAAAGVAVQAGKTPDADKILKLEITFHKLQDAVAPVIKDLPFEDAIAARRFLNQMNNAIKALRAGAATGLIDPRWAAEGLTVADLVRHMTKFKLQFAAAPQGGEEAYATMHRNLATYLFVLNQVKK
jgi:hypothetical protein